MNILLVTTCLGVGGAEKVVVTLADRLENYGHNVIVVYLRGEAVLRPKSDSIKLYCLKLESLLDLPIAYLHFRSLVSRFNPDVIHSHSFHANILARIIRLTINVPKIITTAHNTNEGGKLRMLAYRLTDKLADLSTNVSDEAVKSFVAKKAVKCGRMITVHNGISVSDFRYYEHGRSIIFSELGISADSKVLLAVGRFQEQKDYPNLLKAFSLLNQEYKTVLLIAGDGPLRDELFSLAEAYGFGSRVHFLGVRRDVVSLFSAADVFVLSSAWEGFPLVVGEAMACECLVVATDCGGVREFVGDAGFLAPVKDPHALARQIELALKLTQDEKEYLVKAARSRIENLYSLDTAVNKWNMLYSANSYDNGFAHGS